MADKHSLLNQLRIDRDQPKPRRRPWPWFLALAVVAGIAFAAIEFGGPLVATPEVRVETVVVAAADAATDSVLDATGYVVARRQATVSAKTTGKVLEVHVEEGMTVAAGQLLAVLDARIPEAQLALAESRLAAARSALDEIRVQIKQAELDVERTANLAERNLASRADLDRDRLVLEGLEARFARAERDIEVSERSLAVQRELLEDMQIRAPFGGVVIAKAAQPGEMISPVSAGGGFTRTGICTIVDMESLEVEVDVNEAYINRVRPEQPVTVRLNAYPDFAIAAAVIATIPAADRNKATVRVRIGFLERDPRILPDMGVKVAFLTDSGESAESVEPPGASAQAAAAPPAVLAPTAAVLEEDGSRYVWVVAGEVAERRPVRVAGADRGRLRIVEGLASGERVVARFDDALLAALGGRSSVVVAAVSPKLGGA